GDVPSVYRALLAPLQPGGRGILQQGATVELRLAYPWPDLERVVCHPALSPSGAALGPFGSMKPSSPSQVTPLPARVDAPEGRPFLDAVSLAPTEERTLSRVIASQKNPLVLGAPAESATVSGPALFATYLAF